MVETVTIDALGAQGDGVTADGLFVAGGLPGETARVRVAGHRAEIVDLVARSAERAEPGCPHFGACGGCTLQHGSDRLLASWKRELVQRALAARGIEGVEVLPTHTVPAGTRRRVVLAGRRTRRGTVLGFHEPASDEVVDIGECAVAHPAIAGALPTLRELVAAGASRKGTMRLTVTQSEAGLDVAATGGRPVDGALYGDLAAAAARADLARLAWEGEVLVNRRPPGQRFGRTTVVPPPGGFLQATEEGAAALVAAVARALGPARCVADLFAGCGTFSLPLAEHAEVHSVEADGASLAALDAGWRAGDRLKRITTEARDLFRRPLRGDELARFDGLVFDPPRQGARAQADHLAECGPPRIAAVSCNPATFARDARTLIDGGFRLAWVQPVDQFRWSPHVELAAAFLRR